MNGTKRTVSVLIRFQCFPLCEVHLPLVSIVRKKLADFEWSTKWMWNTVDYPFRMSSSDRKSENILIGTWMLRWPAQPNIDSPKVAVTHCRYCPSEYDSTHVTPHIPTPSNCVRVHNISVGLRIKNSTKDVLRLVKTHMCIVYASLKYALYQWLALATNPTCDFPADAELFLHNINP